MNRLLMEDTEGLRLLCDRVQNDHDTSSFREFNSEIHEKVYGMNLERLRPLYRFLQSKYADAQDGLTDRPELSSDPPRSNVS